MIDRRIKGWDGEDESKPGKRIGSFCSFDGQSARERRH